jgi:hypothetical protein
LIIHEEWARVVSQSTSQSTRVQCHFWGQAKRATCVETPSKLDQYDHWLYLPELKRMWPETAIKSPQRNVPKIPPQLSNSRWAGDSAIISQSLSLNLRKKESFRRVDEIASETLYLLE